jgi:predicted RNase H-like nuclease (RuvC/YqgF family)
VQRERVRLAEALGARDAAVQHLAEACASINHKSANIEALQAETEELKKKIVMLENKCDELRENTMRRTSTPKRMVETVMLA